MLVFVWGMGEEGVRRCVASGELTFSGDARCSGLGNAAFSKAITDWRSEIVKGRILGEKVARNGRALCRRLSGLSLAALLFWLIIFWSEAKSPSTSDVSSTAWSLSSLSSLIQGIQGLCSSERSLSEPAIACAECCGDVGLQLAY